MRIFVTGASGFIGRAVVPELIGAGHDVLGLARSDDAAALVAGMGAEVRRGDLDDLDGLRAGTEGVDGVVHLANKHDFVHPELSNRAERAAVQTFADALEGSGRALVLAAGLHSRGAGELLTEGDRNPAEGPDAPRGGAESLALAYAGRGVRVVSTRFAPTVHGEGDRGFIAMFAEAFQRRGSAAYPGDGLNRWAAVHRSDTARLVRLAAETAPAGSIVHAVAEEGVVIRDLVEALAGRLGLAVESVPAGRLAEEVPLAGYMLGLDVPASSARTRELLGWEPTGPTLLQDIAAGHYDR